MGTPGPDAENAGHSAQGHADHFAEALYADLRAIAATYCLPSTSGTLHPTVIVHEAYLKLAGFAQRASSLGEKAPESPWQDREHFLAVAATAMRQVLVDYARRRRSLKRGSGRTERLVIDLVAADAPLNSNGHLLPDVVELDDALRALESADPRAARVVELRFFGGLTVDETARIMDLGRTSVEESWRVARAWLLSQLHPDARPAAADGTRDER